MHEIQPEEVVKYLLLHGNINGMVNLPHHHFKDMVLFQKIMEL